MISTINLSFETNQSFETMIRGIHGEKVCDSLKSNLGQN